MEKKNLFIVCLIVAVFGSATFASLTGVSVDGPNTIALWHMEEVVYAHTDYLVLDDDTNYERSWYHDLAVRGSAQATTGNGGKFGEALLFNGTDAWSQTRTLPQFDQLGIDLWLYADTDSGTSTHHFLTRNTGHDLFIKNTNNTLIFQIWHPDGTPVAITTQIELGKWFHVNASFYQGELSLIVHDANGTSYADASTTSAQTSLRSSASDVVYVGAQYKYLNNLFKGKIDELHIANTPIVIPEPATIALLCMGSFGLLRKRH